MNEINESAEVNFLNPQSSLAFVNFTKMNLFNDGELDACLGKIASDEFYSADQHEVECLTSYLSGFVEHNMNFEPKINKKYDATYTVNQWMAENPLSALHAEPKFIWDWFQVNVYDILVRHIKTSPTHMGKIIDLHNHIHFFDAIVLKSLSRLIENRPIIQASPQSTRQVSHIPNESFDSAVFISDSLVKIPAMIEKLTRSLFHYSDIEYPGFTKAMKGRLNFGGVKNTLFYDKLNEKSAYLFDEIGNRRNDEVHNISELPNFLDDKNQIVAEIDTAINLYKHFQVMYLLSLAIIVENYH